MTLARAHPREAPDHHRHPGLTALAGVLLAGLPAVAQAHGEPFDPQAPTAEALYVPIALLLASGFYLAGMRQRRRTGTHTPRHTARALSFGAGLLMLVLALVWPLDGWAELAFSAHMTQHMVLLTIAPPLLLAGRPVAVWLRGLPAAWRPAFVRLRQWLAPTPLRRLATGCGFAATLHGAVLWIWHAPWLFDLALSNDLVHWLEHLCFLGAGLLFWWAVMRAPRASLGDALLALLVTVIHSGLLGALITLAPRPLYTSFLEQGLLDVMSDQQLAGLIMWVPMCTVYLVAALVLAARTLRALGTPAADLHGRS